MGQQQSQRSGEPPLGTCAVCGDPVTPDDPGTLQVTPSTGRMLHVHTRCEPEPEPAGPAPR